VTVNTSLRIGDGATAYGELQIVAASAADRQFVRSLTNAPPE
jgi:hypothetical protein